MVQEEIYNHPPLHSLSQPHQQNQNRNVSSRNGLNSGGSGDSGFSHHYLPPLSANSDHSTDSHGSGSSRRNFTIPLPAIFDIAPPVHSYTGPSTSTTWNNHTSYPSPDIPVASTAFPFRFPTPNLRTTSAATPFTVGNGRGRFDDDGRNAIQYEQLESEGMSCRGEVSRQNWSLEGFFDALGLTEYYSTFVEEGFSHFESMLDIQEEDFDAMSVKRGSRRRIQRSLSAMQGIDHSAPLQLFFANPPVVKEDLVVESTSEQLDTTTPADYEVDQVASEKEASQSPPFEGEVRSTKRKYVRHPRPDRNTPPKPQSAYLRFASLHRLSTPSQNFGETAQTIGLLWKSMHPHVKAQFEEATNRERETYRGLLSTYRRSDTYLEYQAYVADFKSKHPTNDDNSRATGSTEHNSSPAKRSRVSKAPADLPAPTRKNSTFSHSE